MNSFIYYVKDNIVNWSEDGVIGATIWASKFAKNLTETEYSNDSHDIRQAKGNHSNQALSTDNYNVTNTQTTTWILI